MTINGIISAILIGLIVGALGRLVIPGRQSIPIWLTIVIGIGAALLGTAIARAAGVVDTAGWDWTEIFIQIALAALGVLLTVGLIGRRSIT
ncbi:MAG TPA: GlsB/YeaQ/YmgE family stress response membrane protein [Micromonosporaceae bacterium]|nr:GlsB/YeaQ/YmgE family stress response membrane protein [Micromonosporaceae bacterium]